MNTCPGHGSDALARELRALALTVLDRTEPLVAAMRSGDRPAAPAGCRSCPVCAVLAALRGERPELAVRLAEHAAGLMVILRAALDTEPDPPGPDTPSDTPDGDPADAGRTDAEPGAGQPPPRPDGPGHPAGHVPNHSASHPASTETAGGRRVQRIPVTRNTGPAPRPSRAHGHPQEWAGRA